MPKPLIPLEKLNLYQKMITEFPTPSDSTISALKKIEEMGYKVDWNPKSIKVDDYDFFRAIVAAVVFAKYGKEGFKEVFKILGDEKDRGVKDYLPTGRRMPKLMIERAGYIMRAWENNGFELALDYLKIHELVTN